MKKYLVTGFEAFGGDSINPTEVMLSWIHQNSELSQKFETQLLPVVFSEAFQKVLNRSDLNGFEGIIHFGLAAGRSKISLERVGLNWLETSIADNSGVRPEKGVIDSQAEKVYFTRAPIDEMKQALLQAGLPVEVSLSAGGYVCNHLYFQMLKQKMNPWVIFIHVPYLEEQAKAKSSHTPFLTESQLQKMLEVLARNL